MKPIVGRFVLAVAAFVLWLGWLGYLVLTASQPVVLSRSQFLVTECTIVAELHQPFDAPTTVTVKEVHGPCAPPRATSELPAVNSTIQITNLHQCGGWTESGDYILALVRNADGFTYRVTPLPSTPGYPGTNPPLIYPANAQTRSQMKSLVQQ
jgi:hypothetical protein